jgi:hypothetical protein
VTASEGMKAFFHEDDYGAVEILPVGAWFHCEKHSTHREPVQRTRAWVVSGYMALYASWDESGRVQSIFCSSSFVEPEKHPSFLAAMKALGALRPLLLVDWNADVLFRLDDTEMLQHWLIGEEVPEDED